MTYRTKTYIAADWDSDKDAVEILHKWNDSNYWGLNFHDVHETTQSRDDSLYCSVKKSLKSRMDISKAFVLIVGKNTNSVTKGSCSYCSKYSSYFSRCLSGYPVDYRSYIKYECDKANEAGVKIVVLYKSTYIDKTKCPEVLRNKGTHAAMWCRGSDGDIYWDYNSVNNAFK